MHWLLRSTHLCFRHSFDDVTRINFRFRLLVMWSSAHGRVHLPVKFGADIFIQCGVIDIFPKLKMAAAAILDLLRGAMGPHSKAHSWCVLPVKISS